MSLSVAGVWQVGVWDQTVWADGVWREGVVVAIQTPTDPGVSITEDGRTIAITAVTKLVAISEDTRVIQQS